LRKWRNGLAVAPRDLVTQAASQGLSENEIGCARISMMARSTNAPCKGRIQMRKTNPLHLLKFGLQRTAVVSARSVLPSGTDIISRAGHVRLVPCVDGSVLARTFFTSQAWSVLPCVRPLAAVHMTAGHNALRGSGPGQQHAFDDAMTLGVVLTAGSTGSALRAVRPPNLHLHITPV
jgi:hypothetical protein